MKKAILFFLSIVWLAQTASAFEEQVIMVRSEKMDKDVPVTVMLPDSYSENSQFPVLYLLNGWSGTHRHWPERGNVGPLADRYDVIFVMPDTGYDSWYFDSKVTPEYQYETFVTKELITYIDSNYKTIPHRGGRAVTGLSMGGHGALFLSFRHQDIFASAGSMSGGVDIRPFPEKWGIAKRLGTYAENPQVWEENTVINLTHLLKPGSLDLIIDCGTGDFFYEVNCNLHNKLLEQGIDHDFISRPGVHNWDYWANSIKYQIVFFNDRFDRGKSAE
jgi:S-formylglutathione hydrolase FrmB